MVTVLVGLFHVDGRVDKTWGSCGALAMCNRQTTIKDGSSGDDDPLGTCGRPPHPRGNLGRKSKASAVHPGDWPGFCGHADRGNAGARPDDIRRGRSYGQPCTCPTRQWNDARQAGNRRRTARTATCPVPGRTCRRLSQSGSETGGAAPQDAPQAAQTRHRRHRAQTCRNRKRNPKNWRPMATKRGHVNTDGMVAALLKRHPDVPT